MLHLIIRPFIRLLATSPEIERLPFMQRPRTMAAIWAGLLVCKVGAMVVLSPAIGAQLFVATLVAGIAATYVRFGLGRSIERVNVAATSRGSKDTCITQSANLHSPRPCGHNCR